MLEQSFIENVNMLAKNIEVIKESISLFDEGVAERLESLASMDVSLITQDLSKGNYLGNRKTDINLSLNNLSTIDEVTYHCATLTLNSGIVVPVDFTTVNGQLETVVEEVSSYTTLYAKLTEGITAYNTAEADSQKHIVNYEIDVINETIEDLPTLLRIRDTDGGACNIDRIVLSVYGGGSPVEVSPSYYWTKTTSALEVLANRVGDIIALGENIDKIIALADKEDEVQYLYDARVSLQGLYDSIQKIIDVEASLVAINNVNNNSVNINAVNSNKLNIDAVKNNEVNIIAVADNSVNINAVNSNKLNIDAVKNNEPNIDIVANNKPNIDSVATNMQPILNAHAHAQTSSDKATESSDYAAESKGYRDELTALSVTSVQLVSSASASVSYDSNTGILTIGIPQGLKGDIGEAFTIDAEGTLANRGSYDGASKGFSYLTTDEDPTMVYFKVSDTSGDWSVGSPFGKGEKGDTGDVGNGVSTIIRTTGDGSEGTTDTYTITFTDSSTTTFNIYNGADSAVMSVAGKTGDVVLTKADVGLENVDNTTDANKPISTATQTALNGKADDSQIQTDVPANAKFTDTIYEKPSGEPIGYIENLQATLDAKEPADSTIIKEADLGVKILSPTGNGDELVVDASNFDNNLSSADNTISKALETLDNMTVGGADSSIFSIGVAGKFGFGVATCPADLIPLGWVGAFGHDDVMSPNYGNYIDKNGSILVYIPKHYYKYTDNDLEISADAQSGFVLDRSFINAGIEMNGIFIYKYGASNVNGIFASKQNRDPLSTHTDHSPISLLNGTHLNNYGGLYTAVKTAGDNYYLTAVFNYSMLARLALAHGKASISSSACAFSDVAPLFPKGCLNNALSDVNDSSVKFTSSGYSNCALAGSGKPFAKTTHNGQDCGIADLNGNMWEVASGFIRYDADGFLVLKESADITAIVNDSITQTSGGAYDKDLYDAIDISDLVSANDGWTYLGNGVEAVFPMSTDRTTVDYKRTALGIPKATGVSASGTTEFGNDGVYRYLRNEMACLCGGTWGDSSSAGVFAMHLNNYRAYSNSLVGGRASFLV